MVRFELALILFAPSSAVAGVLVVQHEVAEVDACVRLATIGLLMQKGEDRPLREQRERAMETMYKLYKVSSTRNQNVSTMHKACCVL